MDSFVGVGGAPEKTKDHAEKIMNMALDMRDSMAFIKDPRPEFAEQEDMHIKIRIGCHTGSVMAGIVGLKKPKYRLFGTVSSIATRLVAHGDPQCIHISKYSRICIIETNHMFVSVIQILFL